MVSKSPTVGTILTFILGATVGAAVALLFAPKSGEELRGDIADEVSDDVDHVRNAGKNLKRRAQKIAELAEDQLQDAAEAGEEAYNREKKA
jgi:gas vesicle protein